MELKSLKIRTAFNNMFKPKRSHVEREEPSKAAPPAVVESPPESQDEDDEPLDAPSTDDEDLESRCRSPLSHRALPPVPAVESDSDSDEEVRRRKILDYAASIEKVKDCGWYWGPVSGSTAEKLLSREADGSFIVRDSSNEHYIFSLSFKLDGSVRHVRIEQDQGACLSLTSLPSSSPSLLSLSLSPSLPLSP